MHRKKHETDPLWRVDQIDGNMCQRCGACCLVTGILVGEDALDSVLYVPMSSEEAERIPSRFRQRYVSAGDDAPADGCGYAMKVKKHPDGEGAACAAFEGPIGGPCTCCIYPNRPNTCRKFEPGSSGCQDARAYAGLPTHISFETDKADEADEADDS